MRGRAKNCLATDSDSDNGVTKEKIMSILKRKKCVNGNLQKWICLLSSAKPVADGAGFEGIVFGSTREGNVSPFSY